MRVLTVNTGSSSVKLRLLGARDELLAEREFESPTVDVDPAALGAELDALGPADAIAHRIVHGGERRAAARLDAGLRAELGALTPLAPLHQPKALAAVDAAFRVRPQLPAVACFDTAFHAGAVAVSYTHLTLPTN